jgi:hypothetical protein
MAAAELFSETYKEARLRFVAGAKRAGGQHFEFTNPAGVGALGEALVTDVALLGSPEAQHLLVLVSGTHGVEGFCGSGCQLDALLEGYGMATDRHTATLFIHAINPFGFSWCRRVNEDNVDLNRNAVDHEQPPATHPDYAELHPHLLPEDWTGEGRETAERALAQFVAVHGYMAFQAAVTLGQYTHPDGLFYGGQKLAWSTRTFQEIMLRFARGKERVALIDFHTGLGPPGYGEPIYTELDAAGLARARSWYGPEVTSVYAGDSSSAPVQGALINATRSLLPGTEVTPLALEFGTLAPAVVMTAMRAEQWLTLHGQADPELANHIKREMRASFYVDSEEWRSAVLRRGRELIERALRGLATPVP